MTEWYTYSDEASGITIRLPRQLKKARAGLIFRGKLDRADVMSEIQVIIEPNLVEQAVKTDCYISRTGPVALGEWPKIECRYSGDSVTREGGCEWKITYVKPPPHGRTHNWTITFPCNDWWTRIRIDNFAGGLTWEQLEAVGEEIIRSFHLNTQEGESVSASSATEEAEPGEPDVEWLVCDGGPHLVLPRHLERHWKGVDPYNVLDPESDYGRACAVTEPIGLIPLAKGQALVLAGSPPMTGWIRTGDAETVTLCVVEELSAAGPEDAVAAALNAMGSEAMVDTGLRLTLKKPGLILLFAGDVPGDTAYGEIDIPCPAGICRVLEVHYEGSEGAVCVLRLEMEKNR